MVLAAAFLWSWLVFIRHRRIAGLPWPALFILAATLIPPLQYAGGLILFRGDAAFAAIYLLGLGLAVVAGADIVLEWGVDKPLRIWCWLLLLGCFASMWLSLYQWLQLDYLGLYTASTPAGGRAGANFNQPNHLGTFYVLGLLANAYLAGKGRYGRVTAAFILVFLGFGLAMTQSRLAYMEVAVVVSLMLLKRRHLPSPLMPRVVLGAVVVLVLMIPVCEFAKAWAGADAGRPLSEVVSGGTRTVHWAAMADAVSRRPWLGYGWCQTAMAQYVVAPDHGYTGEVISYSHNILLDMLAWNGVPLGLLVLLLTGTALWKVFRRVNDLGTIAALGMVLALIVHAGLEYALYYTYFLLPFGMLCGGLWVQLMPGMRLQTPRWFFPALLGFAGMAVVAVTHDYAGLDADYRTMRMERARVGLDKLDLVPSNPLLLNHAAAFIQFSRRPEHENMSKQEIVDMGRVAMRFPSAPNLLRYAAALKLNGSPVEANEVLRRICKTHDPAMCASMKELWAGIGKRRGPIEATTYTWPAD